MATKLRGHAKEVKCKAGVKLKQLKTKGQLHLIGYNNYFFLVLLHSVVNQGV